MVPGGPQGGYTGLWFEMVTLGDIGDFPEECTGDPVRLVQTVDMRADRVVISTFHFGWVDRDIGMLLAETTKSLLYDAVENLHRRPPPAPIVECHGSEEP